MKKASIFKNKFFLITVFVDIVLVIGILYVMSYVQQLIKQDARINLAEIVTQNKNVIASRLMLEMNNTELHSRQLSERFSLKGGIDEASMNAIFLEYVKQKKDSSLIWAHKSGRAINGDGQAINIAARSYFRLGMRGVPNISEKIVSRLTGDDIFVICTPVKYNGEIIGTVQKQYTPQEIYAICSVSLFSTQGSTYIINSQGYILVFSQQGQYSRESDNYYRIVYLTDPEASKRLEADIKNKRSGFMETVIDGKEMFSVYTPIDQVFDWYVISSINVQAVSPNSRIVIQMFYCVLLGAILFFTLSMVSYMIQKRKEQAKIENIAFVDNVTKGITFTKFTIDLQAILQSNTGKQFYICAFDIDNFKFINSFYGFEIGDKILWEIYRFYEKRLGTNELIARIHSDHFIMLINDVSKDHLNEFILSEYRYNDIVVYFSCGLYNISNKNESINIMVDKANMAAQKIKNVRHSHIEIYSEDFEKELTRNEQTKRAIETALGDGEIIPFYQPKVDLYTREVVGGEALARWRKKDGRMISPGEFIPICERSGQIALIDMVIFEQTLQFIGNNLRKGVDCVPISVNFSKMHLENKDFVQSLFAKLEEYRIPGNLIEIELTETVIFDNIENINNFINEIHSKGMKVSMDDFGSGYSSLNMLKDINIDILKIDRGFLIDSTNRDRQKIVFSTIVEMAKKLNIKVVVEGVETLENLELAKESGCSIIQGYYYAKPMDEESFEKYYREGKI